MTEESDTDSQLEEAREAFIAQWGALGTSWGINRTMAKIHALLMVSPEPLSTDDCMERLEISRGNAHSNLKELTAWGLIRIVVRKGERREYFEAEKTVWKIFTMIARERKRREIDPALDVLRQCKSATSGLDSEAGREFNQQMNELEQFVAMASKAGDKIADMQHSKAMQLAAKLFGLT